MAAPEEERVPAPLVPTPLQALREAVPRSPLHWNVEHNENFMEMMRKVLPEVWSQQYFPEDVKRYRPGETIVSGIPVLQGVLKQNASNASLLKELKHVQDMQRRLMDVANHQFHVLALLEEVEQTPDENEEAQQELQSKLQAALVAQSATILITMAQSTSLANELARKAAGLTAKDRPSTYRLGDAIDERDLQEKFQRDLLARAAPSSSSSYKKEKGYKGKRYRKGGRGRGKGRDFAPKPGPKDTGSDKK